MYVREEMPIEAVLKGSAAKVLLHLIRRGGVPGTNAEMMRGSGVHDRNTYYVARSQLIDTGLWENPYRIFQQVPGISQQVMGKTQQGEGNFPAPPVLKVLKAQPLEAEGISADPTPSIIRSDARNWLAEAMQADIMKVPDPTSHRSAEFLERRERQISLLTDAFLAFFGKELTRESAKDMLQAANDSAEDVLDALEAARAKGSAIERPRGYVLSILQKRRTEAAKRQATVRPANIGNVGAPSRGGDEDGRGDEGGDFVYKPDPHATQMEAWLRAHPELMMEDDD